MSRNIKLTVPVTDAVDVAIKPTFEWGVSPSAPVNLLTNITTATSTNLSWTASADADSYNLYLDSNLIDSTTNLNFDFTGLIPNSNQNLGVSAVNSFGESSITYVNNLIVTVGNFRVVSLSSTEVIFEWDNLASATEYHIWESTTLGFDQTYPAGTTQATVALIAGASNEFHITATVDGQPTVERVLAFDSPIGEITSFVASNVTSTSFTVSWNASAAADSYRLWDTLSDYTETFAAGTLTKSFSGIEPLTQFSFRLVAIKGTVETTPVSLNVQTVTWNPALNPYVVGTTSDSVTIAWNDGAADRYSLFIGNTGVGMTTNLTYTFTGLSGNTTYTFAVLGNLGSSWTQYYYVTATTGVYVPPPPPPDPDPIIWATNITQQSFTLNWQNYEPTAAYYQIYKNGVRMGYAASGTTSQAITGLSSMQSYSMVIVPTSDVNGSFPVGSSQSLSVTTLEWALNPSTANIQQTQVTMNWSNVSADQYQIFLNGSFVGYVTGTAPTTYTFTGLATSTQYSFGVKYLKGSAWSSLNSVQGTTLS